MFVINRTKNKTFGGIYDELVEYTSEPPACIACKFYDYDEGSVCTKAIDSMKAYNVVTGEYEKYRRRDNNGRCQNQRYSLEPGSCGLVGAHFEVKDKI